VLLKQTSNHPLAYDPETTQLSHTGTKPLFTLAQTTEKIDSSSNKHLFNHLQQSSVKSTPVAIESSAHQLFCVIWLLLGL